MKKAIALAMLAIFIFSIVPVFADEDLLEAKTEIKSETRTEAKASGTRGKDSTEVKTRLESREMIREDKLNSLRSEQRTKIEAMSSLKSERISNLSQERLQKIAELDKRQLERLAGLNIKNLEKISELKSERLERLAKLSEEKLERVSELEKEKLEKIADLSDEELNKIAVLGRARMDAVASKDKEEMKAELRAFNIVKVKNAEELSKREISSRKKSELKLEFDRAEKKFHESEEELEEAKEKLNDAKQKRNEKATVAHAKNYLLKSADAMISHLEKIKAKVQESENIEAELEAKIVDEIGVQISEINVLKAEIEAAETKEQVKDLAKKLRAKWSRIKHIAKIHSEKVVAARVEGIVNRGIVLEKKLDNVLERMENKSINVDVNAEMELFSKHIADSKDYYKQAQAKLNAAIELRVKGEPADSDKIKALSGEAKELLGKSRNSLKGAHDVLKQIITKIKQAAPDEEISAEVEVEVATETTTNTSA